MRDNGSQNSDDDDVMKKEIKEDMKEEKADML